MNVLLLKDIEFKQDRIVSRKDDSIILKLKDVYGIFYRRWSFKNLFWYGFGDKLGIGFLYIATISATKYSQLIRIRMSFSNVKNLPERWLAKVEFFKFGETSKVERIANDVFAE